MYMRKRHPLFQSDIHTCIHSPIHIIVKYQERQSQACNFFSYLQFICSFGWEQFSGAMFAFFVFFSSESDGWSKLYMLMSDYQMQTIGVATGAG